MSQIVNLITLIRAWIIYHWYSKVYRIKTKIFNKTSSGSKNHKTLLTIVRLPWSMPEWRIVLWFRKARHRRRISRCIWEGRGPPVEQTAQRTLQDQISKTSSSTWTRAMFRCHKLKWCTLASATWALTKCRIARMEEWHPALKQPYTKLIRSISTVALEQVETVPWTTTVAI